MVVADPEGYLLTVCENGYGKRTPFGANTAGDGGRRGGGDEEAGRGARRGAGRGGGGRRGGGERPLGDALPQAAARRQGRARHPHQRAQRPGGRRRGGARRRRHHAHHDAGHGQPHARRRDPRRRPQHAGRAHHEPERGRQDRVDGQGGPGRRPRRREDEPTAEPRRPQSRSTDAEVASSHVSQSFSECCRSRSLRSAAARLSGVYHACPASPAATVHRSWIVRNLLARGDQVWIYDLKEDPRRLRLILPEEQVAQGHVRPRRRDRPAAPAARHRRATTSPTSSTWPACRCRPAGPTRSSGRRSTSSARWPCSRRCKAAGDRCSGSSTPAPPPCSGRRTTTRRARSPTTCR